MTAQLRGTAQSVGQLASLSSYSRFVQRIRRRYDTVLAVLPAGPPTAHTMRLALLALRATPLATGAALRVLRQLVMERLVVLDCDGPLSPADALPMVLHAMTELAELALDVALQESSAALDALHGAPAGPDGQRAQMWVIGMGKLGARELNVSSDIDLIYIYDHEGDTAGRPQTDANVSASGPGRRRGQITNQEYFAAQVKAVYALIGETTEHGLVFRMDLALRPHGGSGPSAMSLAALDSYFQSQGREWERFAWLKSRVVAPRSAVADGSAQALRGSVLPFVFRRYLDYNVFDALRVLHQQIREHAARRSAGHPERANDVKISRGGIREIEFTVQLLQVVRGGQFPELRTRGTVVALQKLAHAGLMPQATAQALTEAYNFLRATEHRIQYLDDQQTHVLPTRDDDLHWIADTHGYTHSAALNTGTAQSVPAHCQFLNDLDTHRELVAGEFDKLLGGNRDCKACHKQPSGAGTAATASPAPLESLLQQLPTQWPAPFRARLKAWCAHARVSALREDASARLSQLVQRTGEWLIAGRVTEEAAIRLMDWIESLLRRESYLALLLERPAVHERLLHLLGSAKWPARYLLQHPGVIDELASRALMTRRFDAPAFSAELVARLTSLHYTGEDDEETCLNVLRRAQHAEVFRTLARDLEGRLSVEQVADDLSDLANAVLQAAIDWSWARLKYRHRSDATPLQFAVIAYGKLGGRELGYGSDLDIVFVYDDAHEQAAEVYGALVRKLISWLTVKTAEGDLYEIDTALRPNGSSGLLVTRICAFENYQLGRGSNTAWTWEHQAMTRARCVYGTPALRERFERIRSSVITAPRDLQALQREVVAMRAKVRLAHPVKAGKFDVKHSAGGMVDAEFAVQFLVLGQARTHPGLTPNLGNITLLRLAEASGLLPSGVGENAAVAYRTLRRAQHQARLNEAPTQVNADTLADERSAIQALCNATLGAPQPSA